MHNPSLSRASDMTGAERGGAGYLFVLFSFLFFAAVLGTVEGEKGIDCDHRTDRGGRRRREVQVWGDKPIGRRKLQVSLFHLPCSAFGSAVDPSGVGEGRTQYRYSRMTARASTLPLGGGKKQSSGGFLVRRNHRNELFYRGHAEREARGARK